MAKEAAHQSALRAAQQKAADALAAMPDGERLNFLEVSIKADTQAYYPLDSGYTGDFSSIYVDPPEPLKGIPVAGEKNPFEGMPRGQVTAFLQKKILADIHAGKPTPMLGRGQAAAVSPFGRRAVMAGDLAAMQADPGLPRLAAREVEWAMEQLIATKSAEQAMQVQTEYVKSAYEAYVAQGTKITELYSNLCKDCYKPFADVIGNKSP